MTTLDRAQERTPGLYHADIDAHELDLYRIRGWNIFIEVRSPMELDIIDPDAVMHSLRPIAVVVIPREHCILIKRGI